MMCEWNEEHIRFARDAADYGDYYSCLAEKLLKYLPRGGRICDVGCGMGDLSLALSLYFAEVSACDVSPTAIAELRCRMDGEKIRVICGDIAKNPAEIPYDGMVFSLFGSPEQILDIAAWQCQGTVCVVNRSNREHRFSLEKQTLHHDSAGELMEALQMRGVPFQAEEFTLEFGQPFRSEEDAMAFFTLYNRENRQPSWESVLARLRKTGRQDFPLYAPEAKGLHLLCFDSRDL